MNALEIIEEVGRHNAELVVKDHRLIVQGAVHQLPEALRDQLRQHKSEVLVALGEPLNVTVASVLGELRPHLPRSLQKLPDDRLLTLINWSIIAAFASSIRKVNR